MKSLPTELIVVKWYEVIDNVMQLYNLLEDAYAVLPRENYTQQIRTMLLDHQGASSFVKRNDG